MLVRHRTARIPAAPSALVLLCLAFLLVAFAAPCVDARMPPPVLYQPHGQPDEFPSATEPVPVEVGVQGAEPRSGSQREDAISLSRFGVQVRLVLKHILRLTHI